MVVFSILQDGPELTIINLLLKHCHQTTPDLANSSLESRKNLLIVDSSKYFRYDQINKDKWILNFGFNVHETSNKVETCEL